MTADFSGYATRNNLRCSDGRTILADAFLHQDGQEVPLVWQHGHDSPKNVLGHVLLENVADGVKAHAYFNNSDTAQHMKEAVRNGDIKFLSIFANQLREQAKRVSHGMIREVSLVLAGANPGATIETITITHSDGYVEMFDDEALLTTGLEIEVNLAHADKPDEGNTMTKDDDRTLQDILDTLNEEQETAVNFLLSQALTVESDAVEHSDTDASDADADDDGADDGAVDDSNVQEAEAAEAEEAAETDEDGDDTEGSDDTGSDSEDENSSDADSDTNTENEAGDDAVQHDNINQEDNSMTHNVFDQSKQDGTASYQRQVLSHDAVKSIAHATLKTGSMKTALEDYALAHGIENIEYLFPDPKLLQQEPSFIARKIEWVDKVLSTVRKTPFARIKTVHADITADEARARGYIKGNLKNEEFFKLIKRVTTPQTIYKKQKLDRDDVIDITDLDIIAFVKMEMKLMLDEEIAGAILIGDGRSNADEDKINDENVRPIASDDELYVTTINLNLDDASSSIEELVDSVITTRMYYKGTGLPTFYTSEEVIGKFLTVKDSFGHRMYKSLDEVKTALRVSDIIPVEVFTRVPDVVGILVNLVDYSIGTDRGGQATMFDDFDLDYNKLRYLLETRLSGALTVPKAAIVYRKVAGADALVAPVEPARAGNVVTVATTSGVVYKNAETDATLTTASPVTLAEGDVLFVKAVPAAGKYFASSENDEWSFEYEA